MDLISIARTIFRHKLAMIPAVIITALGIFYVIAIKPPEYQAMATIVLISPPAPAVAFDGRRIAWVYTPTRQLIELLEEEG